MVAISYFTGFYRIFSWFFVWCFLFLETVAAMFDGSFVINNNSKGDHKCIISPKFGSNLSFKRFFRIYLLNFLSNFLFLVTAAAMFDAVRVTNHNSEGDYKHIISPKFDSNWHFTGFFWIFSWIFSWFYTYPPFFFNNSHVGWSTGTLDIFFKLDTLRIIVAKLGSIWPGIFRGADLWKKLTDRRMDRRRRASDGNRSL